MVAGNSSWQLAFLEGHLRASWHASLLILFVLAAQRLCRRALAPRWGYSLWLLVLARLALPRLHSDRELARYAQVLPHIAPEDATAYGGTIVRLLDGFAQTVRLPGLAGILEDRHETKRRIAMILSYRGNSRSWRWAPIPALALLAAVTLTDAQVSRTVGEGVVPAPTSGAIPAPGPRHGSRTLILQ